MTETPFIKKFVIKGLHYYRDFELKFDSSIIILVGENGLGKTTILNALAHLLQREWMLLSGIGFDLIKIEFANGVDIEFTHAELDVFVVSQSPRRLASDDISPYQITAEQAAKNSAPTLQKFDTITNVLNSVTQKYPIVLFSALRALRNELIYFIGEDYKPGAETFETIEKKFKSLEIVPEDFKYLKDAADKAENADWVGMFVNKCNEYLVNTRLLRTRNNDFIIENKVSAEKLSAQQLSSGEQQLVYIFSRLFLSKERNLCVLFDEPEMSLSLSWQRRILVDVVKSNRCSLLFVITHSPFTFDNELVTYAKGINICLKPTYGID